MPTQQITDGSADGAQFPNTKVGFFGASPVAQQTNGGNATTVAAGSTTETYTNTTFSGGVGTKGYTIGDLVAALKNLGLIAS